RACAADVYWDPDLTAGNNNATTGAGLGGAGTWIAGLSNWWDGSNPTFDQAWNDSANDNAIFWGSAGGAVTITGARTATALTFKTNGYNVTGGSINLGASGLVNVASTFT